MIFTWATRGLARFSVLLRATFFTEKPMTGLVPGAAPASTVSLIWPTLAAYSPVWM